MKDINRDINQPKPFKSELLSRMGGRIEFIDLAKGFCIILVVMHHIEQEYGLSSYMDNVMYMFRMPLYFLLSGLFFKTYNGFKGFLIKKINKLLIPFFFFYITTSVALPNFAHFILGFPMERSADGLGVKSLYAFIWPESYFNNPIWFIWCLFILNLLFWACYNLSEKSKRYFLISLSAICLIIGFGGIEIGKHGINLGANIDTAMSAIPFFCVGYMLNKHSSLLRANRFDKYNLLLVLVFFTITWLCSLCGSVNYKSNEYSMTPLLVYIGGL